MDEKRLGDFRPLVEAVGEYLDALDQWRRVRKVRSSGLCAYGATQRRRMKEEVCERFRRARERLRWEYQCADANQFRMRHSGGQS
jgi:hypothetical protein